MASVSILTALRRARNWTTQYPSPLAENLHCQIAHFSAGGTMRRKHDWISSSSPKGDEYGKNTMALTIAASILSAIRKS